MYINLRNKLNDKGISIRAYAEFLGVSEKTAQNKLNGVTEFTLLEAKRTKEIIFPEYDMFYIFADNSGKMGKTG